LKTTTGNPALIEFIRSEVRKRGPVSFAWFMQQALYHPEHGYYSSGRCVIGRAGDYFTSISVGPLFGQLLCRQFIEIWEGLGKIDNFVIVEQGAHDGQFARDVLEFSQTCAPEFFAALRYRIAEPFRALQERQSRTLQGFDDKIEWSNSLSPFVGVHFSNELLDAMPVRLINGGREKLVALHGDKFVLVERPISEGGAAFQPAGAKAAFNQAALDWIDEVATNLQRGYVIAIDYGRLAGENSADVQVRARHRNLESPFEQIGHADITVRADWATIVERAKARGFGIAGFTDQHHFLTGIVSEFQPLDSPKARRELQTLLHPEMLGRAFQVIALEKNLDREAPRLAGFKFARERRNC
jgi:SAM-dependent MidA family methyltransferase